MKQALWPSDTHVNFDANVNTTVNKLRQILGDSTDKPVFIETIPRKGYSFMLEPEFATEPFASTLYVAPMNGNEADSVAEEAKEPGKVSRRWMTLGIIALILAGILLGAGVAALWISHTSPLIRH